MRILTRTNFNVMNLKLARRENREARSYFKCFGVPVTVDKDMASDFDVERAWCHKGYTVTRNVVDQEQKAIGRTNVIKVPRYTVWEWKSSGYSYWEPPDIWENELDSFPTLSTALLAIDSYERGNILENYVEGEFWEQQAEECR